MRTNGNGKLDGKVSVAYIIGNYPSLTTTFIDREIRLLRRLGLEVQVTSIRRPFRQLSPEQEAAQNEVTYVLPVSYGLLLFAHLWFALLRPLAYWATLLYLLTRPHPNTNARMKTFLHFGEGVYVAMLLRRQGFHHIHAHFVDRSATIALIAGRLLRLPYSLTAHARSIFADPVLLYEKIAGSTFTVTVSKFNKKHILQKHPGLDPNKLCVLHPWVDLSQFEPPESRPDNARLRILSVGRLVEKKGHQYLMEACHHLQEEGIPFECEIIGDGPLMADLRQMVEGYQLNGHVKLFGGQPQSQVLSHLGQADVFVLACVIAENGDRDGVPVALAEAMAMEVPVISTDIVGIGELVQPGTGYLVPANDGRAIAEAIKRLQRASASSRREMGKQGRAVVAQEFDLTDGVRQLAALFEKAPSRGTAAPLVLRRARP